MMGEQLLNNSILDQFINSHEQSYEEFLNTFTYLLKEEEGTTIQGSKVDSLRKTFSASELSNRNKQDGVPGRRKEMWVSLPLQMPNENETVMNESCGSDRNDLSLSERLKMRFSLVFFKVDEHLDLEDIDTDEEMCRGSLVLPGEVEQTVTCCTPCFDKPIQLNFRTLPVPQPSDSKAQELLGDDVQPFSLDEEFDYDNVALTPKFSEAELKAMVELSEEKKTGTDVKSA
ncbi:LOW QUALITY PROTEIN: intraflagellar transport-associated protein [Chlamydotis macqueenii]